MTRHPCTAPHAFGYSGKAAPEEHQDNRIITGSDADIAWLTSQEIEPWDKSKAGVPTNDQWLEHSPTILLGLRTGFALLCKTREELIADLEGLSERDLLVQTLESIQFSRDLLQELVNLATAADTRILCGLGAMVQKQQREGGL